MLLTESITINAKRVTQLISVHTLLIIINHFAHVQIDIVYGASTYMPIVILFCIAPLIAALFLSSKSARQAAVILCGVLFAELIYNIYARFTAMEPIVNPLHQTSVVWKIVYEASYGGMLILEVVSIVITIKILMEIHKQLDAKKTD